MTGYQVDFEPIGRRGQCKAGDSLLDCARQLGVGISSICGGNGVCKSCKVQIISGFVSEATPDEVKIFTTQELKEGWRLACKTHPVTDCMVNVPAESMTTLQRTQIDGISVNVIPQPSINFHNLDLPVPSVTDLRADDTRILDILKIQHKTDCRSIDAAILRTMSQKLRVWKWHCQAGVYQKELISLLPFSTSHIGLAVDLGSTKIAGYLVDLSTGQTLAAKGIMNPQISYGDDIISRIQRAMKSKSEARRLKTLAVTAINDLAAGLCSEIKARAENIVEAVVVGNTAMHHLFLGLPVSQLAFAPYLPAVSRSMDIKCRDIGLLFAPGAYVHLLPNIAGFVGSDHVAMLLATLGKYSDGIILALDIGTNTEVSLIYRGEIFSVSCASGPAFEGGHIKYGMRAAEGAIERLIMVDTDMQYQTIGGLPPIGICGSAVLDAVAQLYAIGVLDKSGRMHDKHPRVSHQDEQKEFIIVSEAERSGKPAITITQRDIREIQLAKAAIHTGIQVLFEKAGISENMIDRVIIAGAFGNYIDINSAIAIGMLPSLPLNKFSQVGNAAGTGARLALISSSQRDKALSLANMIQYIELASVPDFHNIFVQSNYLGYYQPKKQAKEC